MLERILEALELTKEETRIYMRLLETGPSTAGSIAKNIGLRRPTTYNILGRMRDKGTVSQSLRRGIRLFQAEPPRKLEQLLGKKIKDLRQKQDDLHHMIPELERRMGQQFLTPKFQIFEGKESLRNVLMDVLLYRDMETWSFWPVKSAIDALSEDFIRFHNIERIRNRLSIKGIWSKNQSVNLKRYPFMGSGPQFRREIRIAPERIDFSMSYWIYASKVAFVSSQRECYGFVVESTELAALLKTQHQFIWDHSTRLAVNPEHVRPFLEMLAKEGVA